MSSENQSNRPIETLDHKSETNWKRVSDETIFSRRSDKILDFTRVLDKECRQNQDSPLFPAFQLWSADNLAISGELKQAIDQYDACLTSSQNINPFLPNQDFISASLYHKAFAQRQMNHIDGSIQTFLDLFAHRADEKDAMLQAGMLAEKLKKYDSSHKYYSAIAHSDVTFRTDDPAELARRSILRLKDPDTEYARTALDLAGSIISCIENNDTDRLESLISKTHFVVGPAGGHTAFEDLSLIDTFLAEFKSGQIKFRESLHGSGGKRYLPTTGWQGKCFRGEVSLILTEAPQGWQLTGLALLQPTDWWMDKWKPTSVQSNAPLPFSIEAPWPMNQCFTAGGLWEYVGEQAGVAAAGLFGFLIAEGLAAKSCCGWGPRGYYYNSGPTHDQEDAFAIDFTRYRRFVPYDNESGGTPVLAVRDGVVSRVRAGVNSGDSSMANLVEIEHSDPANPSAQNRYTSRYLHLEGPFRIPVSTGMSVRTGTRLGLMDDTGNSVLDHLHFSIHDRNLSHPATSLGRSVRPYPMSGHTLGDSDSNKCIRSENIEYTGTNKLIFLHDFAVQNWSIIPVVNAFTEDPPDSMMNQKWMLTLSGIIHLNLKGTGSKWLRETVKFTPDMYRPLEFAINHYRLPTPTQDFTRMFQVDQWVPHAAMSSIYNVNHSVNSGFAVDLWRMHPFYEDVDVITNDPIRNIFNGMQVDVAVSDNDAHFYRLSYHITLIGKIRFGKPIIID